MSTLRAWVLAVVAVVLGVLGWGVSRVGSSRGWGGPSMHWFSAITLLALAAAVLIAGIRVYRSRTRRSKRRVPPLVAVRTLVLAQASAYVGAGIGGWHAGVLADVVPAGGFGSPLTWTAASLVAVSVVLIVVGYVVQALCKLPPEDSDTDALGTRDDEGTAGVEGAA